ncbi:hypothetical protein GE061_014335 [Apolygus lucorum]|uniref:Uncharacterized protein n=1 Tax=Apolygus lucorum TaxID=248454 RepID=A0A8S9XRM2_APOLU|nr:hypothetical protein GE061_014335 [Apolygus lucorum]
MKMPPSDLSSAPAAEARDLSSASLHNAVAPPAGGRSRFSAHAEDPLLLRPLRCSQGRPSSSEREPRPGGEGRREPKL